MLKTDKKLISAKDLSKIQSVSYAAINHYTDMGLLDVVIKKNRVRMYELEKASERLALIAKLVNEGYTLRIIAKLMKDEGGKLT